jgi:DNA anti-recombination protein RmuC
MFIWIEQLKVKAMKLEQITSHIKNYAYQVWLAILGTVGFIQKGGSKLFSELVEEGKSVEARSKATPAKGGSLAETVVATKEAYQRKVEAKLEEWDAQLDQLTAKVQQAKTDARSKLQGEIDSLKTQRTAMQDKLDELRNSSAAAWEDLKDGVEKAWGDISEALGKVVTHFK